MSSSSSINSIVYRSRKIFKATTCIGTEMQVLAGRPAFARPCEGVHKSMSLMSSSLLLRQCLSCLVHLTWIVFVMGDKKPYSCCFVGCCLQDLFSIARSILETLLETKNRIWRKTECL